VVICYLHIFVGHLDFSFSVPAYFLLLYFSVFVANKRIRGMAGCSSSNACLFTFYTNVVVQTGFFD